MTVELVIPEALWPALIVGAVYRLKPADRSGQWVRILGVEDGVVSVEGIDDHIMDQDIPIERFYSCLADTSEVVV